MSTVLVVEDDDVIRRMIQRSLARHDYLVLEAKDSLEAVQLAASVDCSLDVLLVNVCMPGMHGADLAQIIQHMRPETRVLFMMGKVLNTIALVKAQRMDGQLVRKPFPIEGLLAELKEMLAQSERVKTLTSDV